MRCSGFMLWIDDLTKPDYLIEFERAYHFPLMGDINGFHLLPLLVGVMMFAQQKLMPKPKKSTAAASTPQAQQAEQMQKMMPYMSLIMILLFYKFPSGLNLYIMTSSLFGAIEQWYIRTHIKKKDLDKPVKDNAAPRRRRVSPSWLEKLQKQAEETQKLSSQRAKKHKRQRT
jgi:YidC/Oxa1 family membrane protein insertase